MGRKNQDGRRATKKNNKKKTFQKYGLYTARSCRIKLAQIEAQNDNSKKIENNKNNKKKK